jgi:hypothetical protein
MERTKKGLQLIHHVALPLDNYLKHAISTVGLPKTSDVIVCLPSEWIHATWMPRSDSKKASLLALKERLPGPLSDHTYITQHVDDHHTAVHAINKKTLRKLTSELRNAGLQVSRALAPSTVFGHLQGPMPDLSVLLYELPYDKAGIAVMRNGWAIDEAVLDSREGAIEKVKEVLQAYANAGVPLNQVFVAGDREFFAAAKDYLQDLVPVFHIRVPLPGAESHWNLAASASLVGSRANPDFLAEM